MTSAVLTTKSFVRLFVRLILIQIRIIFQLSEFLMTKMRVSINNGDTKLHSCQNVKVFKDSVIYL